MTKPVVLVTGGGSGIGAGIVARLAAAGWQVVSAGRRAAALEAGAGKREGERDADAISGVVCDITDQGSVDALLETVTERFGRLDALVNNAGQTVLGLYADSDILDLVRLIEVNLVGTMRITHRAIPLLARQGGSILNIGSTLADRCQPGTAAYAASKGAIESLTRALAVELGPSSNIRVNCIRPSVVRSEIMTSAGMAEEVYETLIEDRGAGYPLGRAGDPADIAHMAEFLLSDRAGWVTGSIVDVDGGYAAAGH